MAIMILINVFKETSQFCVRHDQAGLSKSEGYFFIVEGTIVISVYTIEQGAEF